MSTGAALDRPKISGSEAPKGLWGDQGKEVVGKKAESILQMEAADLIGQRAVFGKMKAESQPAKGDIHAAGDKNMPGMVLANVGDGDRNFKMSPKKADKFETVVAAAGENAPIKRNPAA